MPVRDTGEHEGIPYLAAQFIEGMTLDQKLKAEGRLDLATTVRICAQVADGLQALWKAGMVHRDVKPGNILLDLRGTPISRTSGSPRTATARSDATRPATGVDGLHVAEQIRGEPVTGAADIYSLGCVMFECVSGRPPFADREGMRVLWAHLQDEPPDLAARRTDISPGFARALNAALRKEPAQRPSTSVEYARSLAEAAGIPIVDMPS